MKTTGIQKLCFQNLKTKGIIIKKRIYEFLNIVFEQLGVLTPENLLGERKGGGSGAVLFLEGGRKGSSKVGSMGNRRHKPSVTWRLDSVTHLRLLFFSCNMYGVFILLSPPLPSPSSCGRWTLLTMQGEVFFQLVKSSLVVLGL